MRGYYEECNMPPQKQHKIKQLSYLREEATISLRTLESPARGHFTRSLFSPGQNDVIEHEHEGVGKEVGIEWFMYSFGIGAT